MGVRGGVAAGAGGAVVGSLLTGLALGLFGAGPDAGEREAAGAP